MKRIILVCLLSVTFIFGVTSFSSAATVEDYAVVINSMPCLGEKVDKLPNFVTVYDNSANAERVGFGGEYADLKVYGALIKVQDGSQSLEQLIIESPSNINKEAVEQVASILKNKYGSPHNSNSDNYIWRKEEKDSKTREIILNRKYTKGGFAGTIIGTSFERTFDDTSKSSDSSEKKPSTAEKVRKRVFGF